MPTLPGVHLLPSTGEFTYDTVAYSGKRATATAIEPINTYFAPGGSKTDYAYAIDQLQAQHPECATVSIVCAWFCDSPTAGSCHVYPSTTYIRGTFQKTAGGTDHWRCSGLTESSAGLFAIPTSAGGSFVYGGTPSDQSLVRCIQDLKARGFRVIFYPFLLMTASGLPWRGQIGYSPDVSSAATAAAVAFLGSAAASQFTRDATNLTVAYSGSPTDYTYRRMILHYANLCVVAGGVNLFVLGSELRGLETIRGPAWTKAGTTDGSGKAVWDYPFVAGLAQLAADVRSVFDAASLTKNTATLANLITYSADWSVWMGYQHAGANGQWPHLDQLYASPNIDFVAFDNYLPLSDWTTSEASLDVVSWSVAKPVAWPVAAPDQTGLGLSGAPVLASSAYLKANIEGGEKFNWYYGDSNNLGAGFDPNGSGLVVSLPEGDRLAQTRQPYYLNQQLLANKQLRWWWNNPHHAIYDASDGMGWAPHGPATEWVAQSKSILFLEYGFPACDKATNQPNVFFDAKSSASGTPFWSVWDAQPGGGLAPRRDDTIASLALEAVYEYWAVDGHNATSGAGVAMVSFAFACVWNWDARPFPTFPLRSDIWGDTGNWSTGNWQSTNRAATPPVAPSSDPVPGSYPTFPALDGLGWSVRVNPRIPAGIIDHVSGRSSRSRVRAYATYDFELNYDLLRSDAANAEFQAIAGFFESVGPEALFWFSPPDFGTSTAQPLGTGDGVTTVFPLARTMAGYSEPVQAASGVSAVYLNGVAQPGGWSVSGGYGPAIVFAAAPGAGLAVSADFAALWLSRFAEDSADFENFAALLWRFQSVKLQTVRP